MPDMWKTYTLKRIVFLHSGMTSQGAPPPSLQTGFGVQSI